VVCFRCIQKGHKSPDCPTRPKTNRRVKLPIDKLVYLNPNELFGQVGAHGMPITCDSGAQISVVPEECVDPEQFPGELQVIEDFHTGRVTGRVCNVVFTIGGWSFTKKAVTQPGELLRWTPCMAVPLNPRAEMDYVLKLIGEKEAACREDSRYLPPSFSNGRLISGLLAVDGEIVQGCKVTKEEKRETHPHVTVDGKDESVQQVMQDLARIEIEGEDKSSNGGLEEGYGDHGSVEEAEREDGAYELEEADGVFAGGCEGKDLAFNLVGCDMPRAVLAEVTARDDSLQLVRQLAEAERQGYRYDKGIVFRDRLNDRGDSVHQVCVPSSYRAKCLNLVHTKFGHQGRNKMIALLKPYFYWPRMARDCIEHIKGCSICQTFDKVNPPRSRMQLREIASTPFERVAVDLVGPFPTAKAIPLRSTTSKVIER